jgi:hypothetical protein
MKISTLLLVLAAFNSSCATMIEMTPVEITSPDSDVSYGAAILAAANMGYVAAEISKDKYVSQSRFAGTRDEVKWQIEIIRRGTTTTIHTPSVNGDGKVHRRVQSFLAHLQQDARKMLKIRSAQDLMTIGKKATEIAKVELKNSAPSGCKNLGFVAVGAFNKDPKVANVSLRTLIQIETLIRGGNTAVTDNINTVLTPGAIGFSFSLSGTSYECSVAGIKA